MNIILGITGSVAAEIIIKLYDNLIVSGHQVLIVITDSGLKLALGKTSLEDTLYTFEDLYSAYDKRYQKITQVKGYYPLFSEHKHNQSIINDRKEYRDYIESGKVLHIDAANWADMMIIAPCTANTISKIVNGVADNALTSTVLALVGMNRPLIIAPAMNFNMFLNKNIQNNIDKLKADGVKILLPTVKKLKCGDYGIGAIADLNSIQTIIEGHKWKYPLNTYHNNRAIPTWPHPGAFGAVRKYDIHSGVDLYCEVGTEVYSCEDGEVVDKGIFTGPKVNMPWWNETHYITIKGKSGYILYGEISLLNNLNKNDKVKRGDIIGSVVAVLPEDKIRKDIVGHKNSMLHLELYNKNPYIDSIIYKGWKLGEKRPKILLDPTIYLYN